MPKNINHHSCIEGVYSNKATDTTKNGGRTLWNMFDYKREVKADSISVKIEIVNLKPSKPAKKALKIIFLKNDESIGMKLLKGKIKEDECFYTRRNFYFFVLLPILWGYSNSQDRIYQVNNELIIETAWNHGGVFIFMANVIKEKNQM